jgi:hypothetical protein
MGAPEMGIRGMRFGAVEVTAINGADVSLQTEDGWTRTITVAEGTKLTKAGDAITLADIAVGDAVRFAETRNGDGTYTVTAVAVILPLVAGEVTVRTDATITVRQRDGSTVTVNVNGDTDYVARNYGTATLEDIEVGQFILAQGARNEDGSLDATDVLTGHGGFGPRGQRGDKPHATETPANED